MRLSMGNQLPQPQQPGMPNMKVIQQMFPFMMLFFFNKFASGLSLYYLAANVVSMGQMLFIKQFLVDDEKIRAKIEENKAKPRKKSSFKSASSKYKKNSAPRPKKSRPTRRSASDSKKPVGPLWAGIALLPHYWLCRERTPLTPMRRRTSQPFTRKRCASVRARFHL